MKALTFKSDSCSTLPFSLCPLCQTAETVSIGPIYHPTSPQVGGVFIDLGLTQFELRRCTVCQFQFKSPGISPEKLAACYERVTPGYWGITDPYVRQFDIFLKLLKRSTPGRRILDVGCFDGAFLNWIGSGWERFGVEPAAAPAAVAQSRGVKIVGTSLADDIPRATFDAIIALDVVEHIPSPLPFFQRINELLTPGGVFFLVTGNTAAPSWRLFGSGYWYCRLPEHVSFFCKPALDYVAKSLGMRCVAHGFLSHRRKRLLRQFKELTDVAKWLAMTVIRPVAPDREPVGWYTARDHLFSVMRKKE